MRAIVLLQLISLCIIKQVVAYPELYAARASGDCNAVPKRAYGSHRQPRPDRDAKFVISRGGKPRMRIIPGKKYDITLKFPNPRRALVVARGGSLVLPNKPRSRPEVWYGQAGIRNCANRLAFGPQTGYAASKRITFRLLVPKEGGSSISLTVVSASSDTSPLLVARTTLQLQPGKAGTASGSGRPQTVRRQPVGAR